MDLPYVKDCQVDTTQAVLYSQDVTDVHSLSEVNTTQITSNQMSINNNSVGVANLNYLLHYNMLVARAPCINDVDPVNTIVANLMETKSKYFLIRNILARILFFGKRKIGTFATAQIEAEDMIFREFQRSVKDYIRRFRGSPYYLSEIEGVTCVTARKVEGQPKIMRLVPPHTILYKRITSSYHAKFHVFGPNYIKAQLMLDGYWVPAALKRLKKLQDGCPWCRKTRSEKYKMYSQMGSLGPHRLVPHFLLQTWCQT